MILKPCPFCQKPIPHKMTACPYCHRNDEGQSVAMDSAAPPPDDPRKYFDNDVQDLGSDDPYVREQAVIRTAQRGFGVVQALISVLSDQAKPGLSGIAKVLGKIRDRRAIPALIQAMKLGDEDLRASAIWALTQFREPEVLVALASDIERQHPTVQSYLISIMGEWRDVSVVPVLTRLVKNSNRDIAFHAAFALGEMGDARAVSVLRQTLRRKEFVVRAAAAGALRHLGVAPVAASTLWIWVLGGVMVVLAAGAGWWFYR